MRSWPPGHLHHHQPDGGSPSRPSPYQPGFRVGVGVRVGLLVRVGQRVHVGVAVGTRVRVAVGTRVSVGSGVLVGGGGGFRVFVRVAVAVGVSVRVGVAVTVDVIVAVGVLLGSLPANGRKIVCSSASIPQTKQTTKTTAANKSAFAVLTDTLPVVSRTHKSVTWSEFPLAEHVADGCASQGNHRRMIGR